MNNRGGNERCSAFAECVFCSDVLFGCSLNAVRRSMNGVRYSAMLSPVFFVRLSSADPCSVRSFVRKGWASVVLLLVGLLFGLDERLDSCWAFFSEMRF